MVSLGLGKLQFSLQIGNKSLLFRMLPPFDFVTLLFSEIIKLQFGSKFRTLFCFLKLFRNIVGFSIHWKCSSTDEKREKLFQI